MPSEIQTYFFHSLRDHQDLHSFPTRRSSDLIAPQLVDDTAPANYYRALKDVAAWCPDKDRKSTRLNSSHRCISYAVFCLKKKTSSHTTTIHPCRMSSNASSNIRRSNR